MKANNAAMRVFVALLMVVVLASCSTQVARLPDGTTYVNNNLFAKGSLQQGDLRMSGNSEKAAEVAGQYGKALINAALIKTGIEAAESMTNNAVDAVK